MVTELETVMLSVDVPEVAAVLDLVELILELSDVVLVELIELLPVDDTELDAVLETVEDAVEVNVVVGEVI